MIGIKAWRSLLKQLKETKLKQEDLFLLGWLASRQQQLTERELQICNDMLLAINNLLGLSLISLAVKLKLVDLCARLDSVRLLRFAKQLDTLILNQDIQNYEEFILHIYQTINQKEIEKSQARRPGIGVPLKMKYDPDHNAMASQELVRTMLREEEQKLRSEEERSLQLVKQLMDQDIKRQKPIPEADCQVCMSQLHSEEIEALDCGHVFHKKCLVMSLKAQVEGQKSQLKCPQEGCGFDLADFTVEQLLTIKDYQKYKAYGLNAYVEKNNDQVSWCPTADCKYVFFFEKGEFDFHCQACGKRYCLNCKAEWHRGMNCQQYKDSRDPQLGEIRFLQFVRGSKFKQCPRCKIWVEKVDGCESLTCKCGTFFCYSCGGIQAYDHGPCACNGGENEQEY